MQREVRLLLFALRELLIILLVSATKVLPKVCIVQMSLDTASKRLWFISLAGFCIIWAVGFVAFVRNDQDNDEDDDVEEVKEINFFVPPLYIAGKLPLYDEDAFRPVVYAADHRPENA